MLEGFGKQLAEFQRLCHSLEREGGNWSSGPSGVSLLPYSTNLDADAKAPELMPLLRKLTISAKVAEIQTMLSAVLVDDEALASSLAAVLVRTLDLAEALGCDLSGALGLE